jgi:hypothetical protein
MGLWSSIKRRFTGGDAAYFESLANGDLAARADRGQRVSRSGLRREAQKDGEAIGAASAQRVAAEQAAEANVRSLQEVTRDIRDLARRDIGILTQERASLDAAFVSLDIMNEVRAAQGFIDRLHEMATLAVKADEEAQVLFAQIMQHSAVPGETQLNGSTWKQLRDDATNLQGNLALWEGEFKNATARAKEWRELLRAELKKVQEGIRQLDSWLKVYPKYRDLQLSVISEATETATNARRNAVPGRTAKDAEMALSRTRTKLAASQRRHEMLQKPWFS